MSFYGNLTLIGLKEDRDKAFQLLFGSENPISKTMNDYHPDQFSSQYGHFSYFQTFGFDSRVPKDVLDNDSVDRLLHDVAVATPNVVIQLHMSDFGENGPPNVINRRFHGDMFQRAEKVQKSAEFIEGADVPFDQRPGVPKPMFVLCEETKDKDGNRDFQILALSENRDLLRQELRNLIQADEYGLISRNGVDHDDMSDDNFMTNCDGGYLHYYIEEHPVATKMKDLRREPVTHEQHPVKNPYSLLTDPPFFGQEVIWFPMTEKLCISTWPTKEPGEPEYMNIKMEYRKEDGSMGPGCEPIDDVYTTKSTNPKDVFESLVDICEEWGIDFSSAELAHRANHIIDSHNSLRRVPLTSLDYMIQSADARRQTPESPKAPEIGQER